MKRPHGPSATTTILDCVADENLFAPWFKDRDSWRSWFVFLLALFALPMNEQQLALYRQCIGRQQPPTQTASEAWLVCGRRAGKSFILALVAVFLACFHDYRQYLARGERGTILVIAVDRRQARVCLRYIRALLTNIPMLACMIEREAADTFDLKNQTTIEVHTASFRSTRGYTVVACLCDEIAFWRNEDSAEPDMEILNAIKPGMGTIPNAMLLCASSPHSRKGALWETHRRYYGKDNSTVLVWQAPTRVMNPTFPQRTVDEALERDPAKNAAEYLAVFRTDVETFVSREVVEASVPVGLYECAREPGVRYYGFVDPSGGSVDSAALAIAHRDDDSLFLDCVREIRAPHSPEQAVAEFAGVLKSYGLNWVQGDNYAKLWPVEVFARYGIRYEQSAAPKSVLYQSLLPLLNSKRVSLLDHPRLINQLVSLERNTTRGDRENITHPPGAHDDVANACAGAILAAQSAHKGRILFRATGTDHPGRLHEVGPNGQLIPIDEEPRSRVRFVRLSGISTDNRKLGNQQSRCDATRRRRPNCNR